MNNNDNNDGNNDFWGIPSPSPPPSAALCDKFVLDSILCADFELSKVRQVLYDFPGVSVQDNPDVNTYPMPIYAEGKDEVFVGRIRRDFSQEKTLNMWIVSDNLRKGAATNTVQIAEHLYKNGLI